MTSKFPTSRVEVPPRRARAVFVATGESIRVVNAEGGQVGDLFAFLRDDPSEYLSAAHTRGHVSRLFPAPGEQFVTNRRRSVLSVVEDTSPGHHDMLIPACDPERYRALGVQGWHASCAENLRTAASAMDMAVSVVPQPVNLFMHIPVSRTGDLVWKTTTAAAGDQVTLRAELDCLVVVSACPQDVVKINYDRSKPLGVEIIPAGVAVTAKGTKLP